MGILGGIISTVGNWFGAKDQQKWNEKQFEAQKDFIREQNEYNSPANQVKRLEEAGINPSLALGNISTGNGSSVPQAGTATAAQAGNFSGTTDSILSLINNKNQQNLVKSQTMDNFGDATLKMIDGYTRGYENLARIGNIMKDSKLKGADAFLKGVQADATDFLSTMQHQRMQAEVGVMSSQAELNWLNHAKGMKELEFLPQQQRLEYAERMGNIAKMASETNVNKQELRKKIQETNHEFFKAKGQKFLNELNKKTEQYLIQDRAYSPTRGMTPVGAAATIGNTIGNYLFD